VTKEAGKCPSCGKPAASGRSSCAACGAARPGAEPGAPAERPLPEDVPAPQRLERPERIYVPVEYEKTEIPGEKKLLEAGDEVKVDRADMVEKETYMCLICGTTVPVLADKCPICGTIFVDETEARTFTGLPVARVPRRGELSAAEAQTREVPRAVESVNLELTTPRPLSAHALKEADVLPVMEPPDHRKVVIKKKVLKKARK